MSISGHFFDNFINSFHKTEVRWAQHVKTLFGSKYSFVLSISKQSLQIPYSREQKLDSISDMSRVITPPKP